MDPTGLVKSLPFGVFVAAELFLLACAAIMVVAGVAARRQAALVGSTARSPIEFAEDGYRALEGTIEPAGAELAAPLTGWPCVWYRFKVEKFVGKRTREDVSRWQRVDGATSGAPFVLRDATGACLVHPQGAEITPTDFSVWYGPTREPEDRNPERKAPTESRTPMVEFAGGSHKFRYTEERIYAGDPLLALGEFSSGRFSAAPTTASPAGGGAAVATGLRASVAQGEGKPFILAATSRATHVAMQQFGAEAAFYVALVPVAGAVVLALMRAQ